MGPETEEKHCAKDSTSREVLENISLKVYRTLEEQ